MNQNTDSDRQTYNDFPKSTYLGKSGCFGSLISNIAPNFGSEPDSDLKIQILLLKRVVTNSDFGTSIKLWKWKFSESPNLAPGSSQDPRIQNWLKNTIFLFYHPTLSSHALSISLYRREVKSVRKIGILLPSPHSGLDNKTDKAEWKCKIKRTIETERFINHWSRILH